MTSFVRSCIVLALTFLSTGARAQAPEKDPGSGATGKTYTWKSTGGLSYEYFVPKDYDPEAGANLTFILHGSNLDRRWGFANHKAGEFRSDDIVVSPDGTTPNGSGGFNSLQGAADLERMHALHSELKELFKIEQTFLYGHSQGSFFSLLYAGAYPDEVDGVVGQASGVWIGTQGGKKHHHQAIVLMHGTADPVVPYSQSRASLSAHFAELDYPMARLRSLDGWNHWPSQHHAEQQLAWCEGMTTDDPVRLAACLSVLDNFKEAVDPVAVSQVAQRAIKFKDLDSRAVKDAESALDAVAKTTNAHIKAIEKALGKKSKGKKLQDKSWVGHLPLFLRDFRGVSAADEFVEHWDKVTDKQADAAKKLRKEFWKHYEDDPTKAFDAGVELVSVAFLLEGTNDDEILGRLETWRDDAKALKLPKSQTKAFDKVVPMFRSSIEKGEKAFGKVGKKYR